MEDDADAVACLGAPDQFALADDRGDRGCGGGLLVAGEGRCYVQFGEDGGIGVVLEIGVPSGAFLVVGEEALELIGVDAETGVAGDLGDQVERHAVGVVEQERLAPGDPAGGCLEARERVLRRSAERLGLGLRRGPERRAARGDAVSDGLDLAFQRVNVPG